MVNIVVMMIKGCLFSYRRSGECLLNAVKSWMKKWSAFGSKDWLASNLWFVDGDDDDDDDDDNDGGEPSGNGDDEEEEEDDLDDKAAVVVVDDDKADTRTSIYMTTRR